MAHTVKLTPTAERQVEQLPKHVQKRVARWQDLIGDDPLRPPSRQLEGYPDFRRVHASKDYVIVYSVIDEESGPPARSIPQALV